ncbi:hypothetical protein CBR_g56531 [Chara braunii]|uniref:Uncharacterized protein n=1 Tax=Chara braunii TaxID=69332 RepID=A0A388MDI7_CHABU|nr:hypothetical protein CBR_g56531 [Chara braunii]|eukprot:GBG92626.1 hypothetical protein CBR_g56531 [Chara braunii]
MGNTPNAQSTPTAHCDDLAVEEEERLEMECVIAAISATALDSLLASNKTGGDARDQYTAFAPIASAYWFEHTSIGSKHAIWKMDTFNHLAHISVRALQFLGNVTDEQVKHCRAQIVKGKLKFCGRVSPLDPQDLKFPSMHELDPDKCGETNSGMWQKGIRQDGKPELRILRKVWSVSRPYLKCKCKKEKSKDCGDTPLWFDHAIWYLLAHPDILFPGMSSIKIRTSMLIHYLRTTWSEGVLAAISFHFLRDLVMGYTKALEEDATLNVETVLKEDHLWNYLIPAALARIMLRTRIPEKPTREKSMEVQEPYEVRPNLWWVIASVGEFHANLPEKVYSVFTADITRCFEAIPTDNSEDSLPTAIRFYVQCAMQVRRERSSCHTIRIRFGENGSLWPSWVDNEQREEIGSLLFKEGDICWITEWCIANSVLRMGDYVWRQVRGIPMGLACSPIWCDIYFFKYEFHAMMRLKDTGNAHLVPCFESTFRYIDDLSAINNAVIKDFLRASGERDANDPYWIYPDQFIEIKENTEVCEDGIGPVANFPSMTITVTSPVTGTYITSKHDKRAGISFSPCRFMKYRSNRSTKQSLQIIMAQVAQILLICSESEDATNEIAKVVEVMVGNGFAASACWKVVKKTLRNAYLYQPGRLSVHMIREALANLHGVVD